MAVVVKEGLMEAGSWEAEIDYRPAIRDELLDATGQPRDLRVRIYDRLGRLVMVAPVLRCDGDEAALVIGGDGPLWYIGAGGVGPVIRDREYVSGADKLSNGSFDLGDLYWVLTQGSRWTFGGGKARHAGAAPADDVLASDEVFATRPGDTYALTLAGITGTGKLRGRVTFGGAYQPPDLLVNGNFEAGATGWTQTANLVITTGGARSGTLALRAGPIPQPQLISGSEFSSSAGWTLGPTMSIAGGSLIAGPNPKPNLFPQGDFEAGAAGWTTGGLFYQFLTDPAQAHSGSGSLQMGPIGQLYHATNPGFDNGTLSGYGTVGTWSTTTTFPHQGTYAALTASTNEPTKYIYLGSFQGRPGERFRGEAYIDADTMANGTAQLRVLLSTGAPVRYRWFDGVIMQGSQMNAAEDAYHRDAIEFDCPVEFVLITVYVFVFGQTAGQWRVDNLELIKIRGNTQYLPRSSSIPVTPGQRYEIDTWMRSSEVTTDGSVKVGALLTGAGKPDLRKEFTQGATAPDWTQAGKWINPSVDFTPPAGYTAATPYIFGQDLATAGFFIDDMRLRKVDNNYDTSSFAPFAVTPEQRYILTSDVYSDPNALAGSITVGVTLTGPGQTPQEVAVTQDRTEGQVVHLSTEVRPGVGYTTATPFVRSKDIEAGNFLVDYLRLVKADNNSEEMLGTSVSLTPERTYRFTAAARSGPNLQRGSVSLRVRCHRTGFGDQTFESSRPNATAGEWTILTLDVTPPSGYTRGTPSIVGTDIDGDYWWVDEGVMVDTDAETVVVDGVVNDSLEGRLVVAATAPEGTTSVRASVLVDSYGGSWSLDSVALGRSEAQPARGNAIVADLLKDGATALPIIAGKVLCPEVIPYDWRILNLTPRQALDHYANVVSEPAREYRVRPTIPPELDVGTADAIFADHAPGSASPVVLQPSDSEVARLDPAGVDVADRATEVLVIGAERRSLTGPPILITATAPVAGARPLRRTRLVSDSTVDHFGYAQALADDLAAREAQPPLSVQVNLSGPETRTAADPGDWVYVYHPASGLDEPGYPVTVDGRTIFPRRVRVLERERSLAAGRLEIERPDGTTFDLPGVRWGPEETSLTVGDRLLEWQADPLGQAEGVQYIRDRASRPR